MRSTDYPKMSTLCCVRLSYNNYMSSHEETGRRYLLEFLYLFLANCFDMLAGWENEKVIRHELREMIANTWKDYLCCRDIRTFWHRLGRVFRVRFDCLYRLYSSYK